MASGNDAFAPVVGGRDAGSSRGVACGLLGDADSDDDDASEGDLGGIDAG